MIPSKNSVKHWFSTTELNEMNATYRKMKSCGVAVDEYLEVFPGNSFINFSQRKPLLKKLRRKINSNI